LAVDHRVADGSDANIVLRRYSEVFANPLNYM